MDKNQANVNSTEILRILKERNAETVRRRKITSFETEISQIYYFSTIE